MGTFSWENNFKMDALDGAVVQRREIVDEANDVHNGQSY
jgi:hypothetical protein